MRLACIYPVLALSIALAGCGSGHISTPGPTPEPQGVEFGGTVKGGQQPVAGARVYLFAAGTGGYGTSAKSLLTSGDGSDSNGTYVLTNSIGHWSISGDWSCPAAAGDQVYLVSAGGNPGNNGGTPNPNLVLISAIGSCSSISATSSFVINEVTTAASAYALAPLFTYTKNEIETPPTSTVAGGTLPYIGIPTSGASCTAGAGWLSTGANTCNYTGLKNAFGIVEVLANLSTGAALAGSSIVVAPQAELNTLADILASCVNSTGGVAGDGSNCGTLFETTTPASTNVAPTDTFQAILNLAQNPQLSTANNASFYALASANPPFSPGLTSDPADWTLPITLSGGGLNGPTAMGIDSGGNVWVVSYNEVLSAFSPRGQPLFASGLTGNGLYESYGLAIDTNNNVWVTNNETPGYNSGLGTISEFTNSGQAFSGSPYVAGDIDYPYAIAAASDGSVWIANYGNSSVTHLGPGGTPVSGVCNGSCGFFFSSLSFPDAVAVDASNNAWVANDDNHTVTEISASGTDLGSVNCCDEAGGLAIDSNGNVWSANYAGSSVSEVSSTRTVISSGYTGGGIELPDHLAVDGNGTVWVANYRGASFSELAGSGGAAPGKALSPTAGFGSGAGLVEPWGIAVDPSGNLWISNFASGVLELGTVTEFVGIATPVNTPGIGPARIP